MKSRAWRLLPIALLLGLGVWAAFGLRLGSDLTRFMPAPHTADERLIVGEIGSGAASRLLLAAIAAKDVPTAMRMSRELRDRLRDDPAFVRIHNGEVDALAQLQQLLPLRFTHSPGMDRVRFDVEGLADVLRERLADLGGAGGDAFEALLAHDPQFLTLTMAEAWRPLKEPALRSGVWFTKDDEALLLIETHAAGFDPGAQADALMRVRHAFDAIEGTGQARLVLSGAGSFSARMSERVGAEATWLGATATVLMIALLWFAYGSPFFVLASALPLLCAAAAGIVALKWSFGDVHGITLAFAVTLIGVAQDYPMHLLSHARPGVAHPVVARSIWPALRLGAASTIIAYATLFSADVQGLAQLATFTIAGLVAAALVTRYLLPALLPPARRDVAQGRFFAHMARRVVGWRAGPWPIVPVLALAGAALVIHADRAWWNNDLASLTPLPEAWLIEDARLRDELATPDARYVVVLKGNDEEAVLKLSERLTSRFDALRDSGALVDHGLPSRYRPSAEIQRWRLSKLPAPETLRAALADAADLAGFEAAFFEPMVDDVRAARHPQAWERIAEAFAQTPAGTRTAAMLRRTDAGAHAVVELTGLADPAAVRDALVDTPDAQLLDMKATAETMVAAFRHRVLTGLGVAAAVLLVLAGAVLGPRRALRVLMPVSLGLVATVAILRLLGVELTLFHLIALMLAAGLGMDYALFFVHTPAGEAQRRTLHAVLMSAASTTLVFGLLATSSIPVLNAIGVTVAVGIAVQFLLSLSMAQPAVTDDAGASHA